MSKDHPFFQLSEQDQSYAYSLLFSLYLSKYNYKVDISALDDFYLGKLEEKQIGNAMVHMYITNLGAEAAQNADLDSDFNSSHIALDSTIRKLKASESISIDKNIRSSPTSIGIFSEKINNININEDLNKSALACAIFFNNGAFYDDIPNLQTDLVSSFIELQNRNNINANKAKKSRVLDPDIIDYMINTPEGQLKEDFDKRAKKVKGAVNKMVFGESKDPVLEEAKAIAKGVIENERKSDEDNLEESKPTRVKNPGIRDYVKNTKQLKEDTKKRFAKLTGLGK